MSHSHDFFQSFMDVDQVPVIQVHHHKPVLLSCHLAPEVGLSSMKWPLELKVDSIVVQDEVAQRPTLRPPSAERNLRAEIHFHVFQRPVNDALRDVQGLPPTVEQRPHILRGRFVNPWQPTLR